MKRTDFLKTLGALVIAPLAINSILKDNGCPNDPSIQSCKYSIGDVVLMPDALPSSMIHVMITQIKDGWCNGMILGREPLFVRQKMCNIEVAFHEKQNFPIIYRKRKEDKRT